MRLADRVFDVAVEGASGLDVVEPGLPCRLDLDRRFRGCDAVGARLAAGDGRGVHALRLLADAEDDGTWLAARPGTSREQWVLAAAEPGHAPPGDPAARLAGPFETPTSLWVRPGRGAPVNRKLVWGDKNVG